MKELQLAKAFMLIEPGPVTLVTTAVGRRKNIMTISWTLVMDFTPRLAFVTGRWNHSYRALVASDRAQDPAPRQILPVRDQTDFQISQRNRPGNHKLCMTFLLGTHTL
jgi:hypothetical protein